MYTKLEVMAMIDEDAGAPDLFAHTPKSARKHNWLMRLFIGG